MDQNNPTPALTQDEVRVAAWAESGSRWNANSLRLVGALWLRLRRILASVLDIGCGGGETALDLARAVAPDSTIVGVDLSAAVLAFARHAATGCERVRFVRQMPRCSHSNRPRSTPPSRGLA